MPRAKKEMTEESQQTENPVMEQTPEIQQGTASQGEHAAAAKHQDEREAIHIPRAVDGDTGPYFVSVNGVNYLLPRGRTSRVPKAVAEEIRRSWAAQDAWDDRAEALAANAQA